MTSAEPVWPELSVAICSHNPQKDYLLRVVNALKGQSLPCQLWDLVVIDNASKSPIREWLDVSWHPSARHIQEDKVGLTNARLRAIKETAGNVIVFVDDDNVVGADFLKHAQRIGQKNSFLGAWGGRITAEFEKKPDEWTKRYWNLLAIRDVKEALWSNDPEAWWSQPCGAGLCIRRNVAVEYARQLATDAFRRSLDRTGTSLMSTGDTDMVLTARAIGLGWGVFPDMEVTHIIPSFRLSERYLLRLVEAMATSQVIQQVRSGRSTEEPARRFRQLYVSVRLAIRAGLREARFYRARQAGLVEGFRRIALQSDEHV
jgi:glycosyltransferase involved in cell wall biosynthesis